MPYDNRLTRILCEQAALSYSKVSLVSVKGLCYYDELGLLKPARVDVFTGYRYYSAGQHPRLNRILVLKDLGLSLLQIVLLLDPPCVFVGSSSW